MMIRFAQDSDLPALNALWQEAFEASAQEADFYFSKRHRHDNMLVATANDDLAGMLSMLPITLVTHSETLSARYVFAVATFKQFRGQGISSQLLEAAHTHMQEAGMAASILVPASPSLFDFYGKRGYETAFYLDSLTLFPQELSVAPPDTSISPCSTLDYLRLRDQAFSSSSLYVRWDQDALAFMADSTRADGGDLLYIKTPQGEAACLYEWRDGSVRVTELALAGLSWQASLAALHQHVNAPSYTLRMPEGTLPGADHLPFGMVHWFTQPALSQGDAPYLSLAKD